MLAKHGLLESSLSSWRAPDAMLDNICSQKRAGHTRGMRMGGGTINTWICADGASQPGSGYVLANFRGPRWRRQPLCGQEYPYTSAGWGWVDFINFCEAANLTAAVTLSELDDPVTLSQFYVAGVVRQVSNHVCCRRTLWNTCMVLL